MKPLDTPEREDWPSVEDHRDDPPEPVRAYFYPGDDGRGELRIHDRAYADYGGPVFICGRKYVLDQDPFKFGADSQALFGEAVAPSTPTVSRVDSEGIRRAYAVPTRRKDE